MAKEVDFDKIDEKADEFKRYEGFLPLLIRAIIIKQHTKTLRKCGLYETVIRQEIQTKPQTYDEAVNELAEWCNENEEHIDLIKW